MGAHGKTERTFGFFLCAVLFSLLAAPPPPQQTQAPPGAPPAPPPPPPPATPSPRPTPDSDTKAPPAGPKDPNAFPEPANEPPRSDTNAPPRSATDDADQPSTPPPPMPPIRTVPEGSVPPQSDPGYTIRIRPTMVVVPVMVKDNGGQLVNGLLPKDFTVLENGQKQQLKFFTSDPFPLSAAVIFDLGMPDAGVRKVQETLPALEGAFSQFDEVGIYTYSGTVSRVADFGTVG